MHRTLTLKVVSLVVISMGLFVLLSLLDTQISKRQALYQQAKSNINKSWTGIQQVMGPVLVVPYDVVVKETLWNDDKSAKVTKVTRTNHFKLMLPHLVRAKVKLDHEFRQWALFQVPVYDSVLGVNGQFDVKAMEQQLAELEQYAQSQGGRLILGQPYLTITLSDMRGLDSVSPLNWHGLSAAFEPASLFVQGSSGLHAKLLPLRELLEHSKSHIAFNYKPINKNAYSTVNLSC